MPSSCLMALLGIGLRTEAYSFSLRFSLSLIHSSNVGPLGILSPLRVCPSGMVAPSREVAARNCLLATPLAPLRRASLRLASFRWALLRLTLLRLAFLRSALYR